MYKNYTNINVNNNILLYGVLQITVLFDMCAAFALGALHDFQISYGVSCRAKTQGAAFPLAPVWRRPWLDYIVLLKLYVLVRRICI